MDASAPASPPGPPSTALVGPSLSPCSRNTLTQHASRRRTNCSSSRSTLAASASRSPDRLRGASAADPNRPPRPDGGPRATPSTSARWRSATPSAPSCARRRRRRHAERRTRPPRVARGRGRRAAQGAQRQARRRRRGGDALYAGDGARERSRLMIRRHSDPGVRPLPAITTAAPAPAVAPPPPSPSSPRLSEGPRPIGGAPRASACAWRSSPAGSRRRRCSRAT